ncbi:cytochrome c peroxidase [Thioalkalicoccus limnaeus]|uniref:Cytochrome c peroxidase n=1 Tax=Thioalkalicoccus limnaeus TaxID=120681 RepID=A0ABV4BIA4_9GAMM
MKAYPGLVAAVVLVAGSWSTVGLAEPDPSVMRLSALPAMTHPDDNLPTPEKIALGHQLFVDPRLSGTGEMACQGCHFHELGWTDAKPLSRKDDGSMNTRHTPTLYNVGYQTAWYWDGRATTLEGQIMAAWRAQIVADPEKATAVINEVPGYREQFEVVWGGAATPETIVKSLAAYLRTKNSDDSPWDRYEMGETDAVSADAVAGHRLFMGEAGCAACHAPPYYGNSTFFNIGLEYGKAEPDLGRYNVTNNDADRHAFKTPTLRSVARSAPYFHDGSVATLEEAVRYMAAGGGPDPHKSELLVDRELSDEQIAQLVAFLEALTSDEGWEAPAIP